MCHFLACRPKPWRRLGCGFGCGFLVNFFRNFLRHSREEKGIGMSFDSPACAGSLRICSGSALLTSHTLRLRTALPEPAALTTQSSLLRIVPILKGWKRLSTQRAGKGKEGQEGIEGKECGLYISLTIFSASHLPYFPYLNDLLYLPSNRLATSSQFTIFQKAFTYSARLF